MTDNQPKESTIVTIPTTIIGDDVKPTPRPETSGVVFVNDFGEDPFLLGHVVQDSAMLGILYVLGTMVGFAVHPLVAVAIAAAGANDFVNAQRREKEGDSDRPDPLDWLIDDREDEEDGDYENDDEIATVPVKKKVEIEVEDEEDEEDDEELETTYEQGFTRVCGVDLPKSVIAQIYRMHDNNYTKEDIILIVFDAKKGGTKKYKAASRLFDTVVRMRTAVTRR